MPKNLKSNLAKLDELFLRKPTQGQKAWGVIHDFYHKLLTYMDNNGITQSQLATNTGKSRSAISQMLNKNPNVSILKLVEITDAVGIDIFISSPQLDTQMKTDYVIAAEEWYRDLASGQEFDWSSQVSPKFFNIRTIDKSFYQEQTSVN